MDANDNILPNVIVSWKLQGLADDYDFSTYTDTKGIARTKVTSTVAGILKMSAYLDLNNHKPIQDVTVTPADIDANKSTFSSNRQSIGGDDKDSALLTVNLMDKYSNTIDGKTVSVKATSGRPNFSDNPLNSLGKGEYQTNLTSNVKTDIILTAEAEGLTIAKPLTIKVTIPKPDIIFDKQIQQETYASAPINALSYTGLPNNINVMWSSSDPTIASIDTTSGNISMKKAGTAIITLQTSGNDQYQPAQSSYPLVIEKAAPILQSSSSGTIKSVWNDGVTHTVNATFGNADVKNIPLYYVSDDQRIASVDTQGMITEVKPGKTKIHIKSDATDQFLADAVAIDYEQDKGILSITFTKNNIILSETDTNIDVQQPTTPLPKEAQGVWSAKDPNIVAIKENGTIIKITSGTTDIILTSKENDYFYESKGTYSVDIRKVPHITINSVTRRIDNNKNAQTIPTINTSINWTPVYENDSLTFSWQPPDTTTSSYDVNLELWDGDQKTNQIFAYDKTQLLGGQTITTSFKIDKKLFKSTQLKIKVIVFDLFDTDLNTNTGRQYAVYYPLNIKPIAPEYMDFRLEGRIIFINTNNGATRGSCQETISDPTTHVIAEPIYTLGSANQIFLSPVTISHNLIDIIGDFSRSTVDYNDKTIESVSVDNANHSTTSHSNAMKEQCWTPLAGTPHSGSATLVTHITINDVEKTFTQSVKWNGDGNPSTNNVEKILNQ
ncbi:hypothetical protein LZ636_06060 [Proteus terrae]|nr:invasin domain 3-containing protein [Proteus terrae]MCE9839247.1 hypothetical protein [Proteus terrae]